MQDEHSRFSRRWWIGKKRSEKAWKPPNSVIFLGLHETLLLHEPHESSRLEFVAIFVEKRHAVSRQKWADSSSMLFYCSATRSLADNTF